MIETFTTHVTLITEALKAKPYLIVNDILKSEEKFALMIEIKFLFS